MSPGWQSWLPVLEPLSIAVLFVYLLQQSWLRWSDPLIDFPRDLYYAWRISEGDVLYRHLANWYGPLANLAQGAGFKLFGVGIDTMVWMNLALTVLSLLLLRAIFGRIGNRLSVWLGSVVFLGVFAVGNLSDIANYNFLTPYVAQSTYCFFGLLVVLWGLLRHLQSDRNIWLGVTGLGLAVAYLDKPEATLAAAGALAVYFSMQVLRRSRQSAGAASWLLRGLAWVGGGFFALWLPVFIYFWTQDGLAFALGAANRVLVTMLDPAFREAAVSGPMMQYYLGTDHPAQNFLMEVKSGALFMLVCGGMMGGAWLWNHQRVLSPLWRLGMFTAMAAAILGGWLGMLCDAWQGVAPSLALPGIGAALVALGWSGREAWLGGADFSRATGLAVVGVAAGLMLTRMALNPMFSHYGFFLMPLAVWFMIHLMVVEAPRRIANPRDDRVNWLLPALFALLVLFAAGVVMRAELASYATKTYEIGQGRDRFFTYQPKKTASGTLVHMTGVMLDTMLRACRLKAPAAQTLVAFPEGIAVNYHLRVPSALAEVEFNPAALGYAGREHLLQELQAHPPEAVCLFSRDYSEYGAKYFGADEASGRSLLLWIDQHYRQAVQAGLTPTSATGHAVDLCLPARPGDNLPPVLPLEH